MLVASGNSQALQAFAVSYAGQGDVSVLSAPASQQVLLHSASACNSGPTICDIGLSVVRDPSGWKLYQVGASNVDATAAIQAGTATDLFPATNGYGFIVQAKRRFSSLAIQVSQASTGSPAYTLEYWNGSAWTALTAQYVPAFDATGAKYVVFIPPNDWLQGSGGAVPAINALQSGYAIRILGATAPGTIVRATAVRVSRFIVYRQEIGAKQQLQVRFTERPFLLEAGESIAPYFSVAWPTNQVEVAYQINP